MDGGLVVVIATTRLGEGADDLGSLLMRSFLKIQLKVARKPDTLIFLNEGVKLVVEGSVVADDIRALGENGTTLLACGTCLDFYELQEQIVVGTMSNMFDIVTAMNEADSVVRI